MYTRKVILIAVASLAVQLAAATKGAESGDKTAKPKPTDQDLLQRFQDFANDRIVVLTRGAVALAEIKDTADKAAWARRRDEATPIVQKGRADLSKKYDEIVKDVQEGDAKQTLQAALDDAQKKLAELVDDPDVVEFQTFATGLVGEARTEVEKVLKGTDAGAKQQTTEPKDTDAGAKQQTTEQRRALVSQIVDAKKKALKSEYDDVAKRVATYADVKAQLDQAFEKAQADLDDVAAGDDDSNAAVSSRVAVSAIAAVVVVAIAA
ncbi:Uncharacterized protein PBTT_09023 [Plasmodiophora brassicae]